MPMSNLKQRKTRKRLEYLNKQKSKRYGAANKKRAYNKYNKKVIRNYTRPFVETHFREFGRENSHHVKFNDTTGAAIKAPDAQMSINSANVGTGANNAVPQDFTCVVPLSFSSFFTQGSQRNHINGRCIYPTYLNLKCELDWSAYAKDPAHETVIGLDDSWMCVKGWAKNTLMSSVQDEKSLPTSSDATNLAMAQIVAKCCQQSSLNGDRLDFVSKKKDIIIQSHFQVKGNLNNRYQDVTTAVSGGPLISAQTFSLPKVMNFSWTLKRKQLLRTADDSRTQDYILADQWIPFVGFYNRNLSRKAHTHTPDLHTSSKLYWTDQ